MNSRSSNPESKLRMGMKTTIAGAMIFLMLFGFTTNLDFASAQTNSVGASTGAASTPPPAPSTGASNGNLGANSCKGQAATAYLTAASAAKTTRDSSISAAQSTMKSAVAGFVSAYKSAATAAESAYTAGKQANLTAAKSAITTAQSTYKSALQTDKGTSKIVADRAQYLNAVGKVHSQYYTNLYQAAVDRAHVIWSAAATRDSNIESAREAMLLSVGQAWVTYYSTLYGDQTTYFIALDACQTTATLGNAGASSSSGNSNVGSP